MMPLDDLVMNEEDFEEALTEILSPYVRISDSGNFVFEEDYDELNSLQKVAIGLLAVSALAELGMRESDSIGPTELAEKIGIPKARKLEDDRVAEKDKNGNYRIPSPNIRKVKQILGAS